MRQSKLKIYGRFIQFTKGFSVEFGNLHCGEGNQFGNKCRKMLLPLLTCINYLLSLSGAKMEIREGFSSNLNLYCIFVGQPSTGKSPSFKAMVSDPMNAINVNTVS